MIGSLSLSSGFVLFLLMGMHQLHAEPGSALYNPPKNAKNSIEFTKDILKQMNELNKVDRARLDGVFDDDKDATVDLIAQIDRRNVKPTLAAIRAKLLDVWHQIDAETPMATSITKKFGPLIRKRVEADLRPSWRRNAMVKYLLGELVKSVTLQHDRCLAYWKQKVALFKTDLEVFFTEIRRLSQNSCIDDNAYGVELQYLWAQALNPLSTILEGYWEAVEGSTNDGSERVLSIVLAVVEYAHGSDLLKKQTRVECEL